MGNHDASYKRLFSHPRMMQDLLGTFVRELDFSTLEKMGSDFVSDKGESRYGDLVWRVKFRGSWLYVCVLLEFQSKVDHRMALRMMVYGGSDGRGLEGPGAPESGRLRIGSVRCYCRPGRRESRSTS